MQFFWLHTSSPSLLSRVCDADTKQKGFVPFPYRAGFVAVVGGSPRVGGEKSQ